MLFPGRIFFVDGPNANAFPGAEVLIHFLDKGGAEGFNVAAVIEKYDPGVRTAIETVASAAVVIVS